MKEENKITLFLYLLSAEIELQVSWSKHLLIYLKWEHLAYIWYKEFMITSAKINWLF